MRPRTRKILKVSLLSISVLVVAVVTFFVIQIGPRNIIGMLKYDQRRDGDLGVGDRAPDIVLTALDGISPVHLYERTGERPTVLVFGSYT